MKVLFWLSIGLDKQATSGHLISAMIREVCRLGNSVKIIQKDTGGNLPPIPSMLSDYSVTTDVVQFKSAKKDNFIARYYADLKYVRACKKYIPSDYDAIFVQSNNVAGFLIKAIKKKNPHAIVTYNVQDIFPYNAAFSGNLKKNSLIFKVLAAIQRYGYRHSDHVITISEDMKDTLISDGVSEGKVEVVYNWSYQDELYKDVDLSPVSHMFDKNYYNIVYAGNIGVMQNVDILIEAAKLIKDDKRFWFHIIGNGVYKERLVAKVKEYGISNISFWPMQPSELAPAIYSAADVNVIPLVKDVYRTALPSKTATCLACQKPIIFAIGKDSKFAKKAMEEAGCLVVESNDAQELAEAIWEIQRGKRKIAAGEFFLKYFRNTENSRKYAETITRG